MGCEPVIAVHGGAGHWKTKESLDGVVRALKDSMARGMDALLKEGAVRGVLEAVIAMEDSGEFNAGLGSVPNSEGEVEMDAGIMDGYRGDAGAVGAAKRVKNPVLLAYHVMRSTPHVLIVGEGADKLARELGLDEPPAREVVRREPALRERFWALRSPPGDTVGAVALDSECRLAAAASTGGLAGKRVGRVGDTPIPGAGFYANRSVAVVATGIGEIIILGSISRRVAEVWEKAEDIAEAIETVVAWSTSLYGSDNLGVLGVDIRGRVHAAYNTRAMPWGVYRQGDAPRVYGLPAR